MHPLARMSSTTLLSTVFTHHGLVKEVDEGELVAIRTLRKGSRLDWLFHGDKVPFSNDPIKSYCWGEREMLSEDIITVNCFIGGEL